jgi:tRNA(fMet)-specific endonuclease VapC
MTALDTDVLSEILAGKAAYIQRLSSIAQTNLYVPVVAAAEVLRGWLGAVRQAESGKGRVSLDLAYRQFERSLLGLAPFRILPYTPAADAQFRQWRTAKLRVGTNDLRIAAICTTHGATLATRNAKDYVRVPGLILDIWNLP